jgi:acyl-CoA thioesterase FadM
MTTMAGISTLRGRPGYEGANIRTWVGFKHFAYLVEAAVLQWFRDRDLGPGRLYHEYGLGLEIIDCSQLLPAVLDVDDEVTAVARPTGAGRFAVRLTVPRATEVTVCRAKVTVALVREADTPDRRPWPGHVPVPVVDDVQDVAGRAARRDLAAASGVPPMDVLRAAEPAAFCRAWRVPYFFCHYSDRVAHSGYARVLEDTVDRFLADRGISVGRLLAERGWIPVVSRSRIAMLADAHVEETMLTAFTVEEVLGGVSYDARMDCYAVQGERLAHVATARILHGYAISRGPDAGRLAELDPAVLDALTGAAGLGGAVAGRGVKGNGVQS